LQPPRVREAPLWLVSELCVVLCLLLYSGSTTSRITSPPARSSQWRHSSSRTRSSFALASWPRCSPWPSAPSPGCSSWSPMWHARLPSLVLPVRVYAFQQAAGRAELNKRAQDRIASKITIFKNY
ncbi:hypothetical protein BAE44_0006863, partial [Dichanthelium oligosanthes]